MSGEPGGPNAIGKALAVLGALPDHERLTDIAAATGLPKSTVHRILSDLVRQRFALSTGDGNYSAGPRILTIAGKVLNGFNPARHAEPALRRLRETTGYTVHFALLTGDEAVYAAKLAGHKPYQMPSRVGMNSSLHSTAIGKAILAALPPETAGQLAFSHGLPRRTPNTITSPTALRAHLAVVRENGYATDEEENVAGIRCVAAAVYGHTGTVTGGVSISTLTLEEWSAPPAELATAVRAAATEISRSLGAESR